jgi:hypothetical protein
MLNTCSRNLQAADLYFFLKKPCNVLWPPAPFFSAPLAVLLIFGFLSLSTDVDDPFLEGAGGAEGFDFGGAGALDFALLLVCAAGASGSESPEYDSSVS